MMRPSVIILLLVASHICYGAPSGAEYPIPDIPVDVALEDNQVEKRAGVYSKYKVIFVLIIAIRNNNNIQYKRHLTAEKDKHRGL